MNHYMGNSKSRLSSFPSAPRAQTEGCAAEAACCLLFHGEQTAAEDTA